MEFAWRMSAAIGSQYDIDYPYYGYQWQSQGRRAHCLDVDSKEVASRMKPFYYGTLPYDPLTSVDLLSYYLENWGPFAIIVATNDPQFYYYDGGIVTLNDLNEGDEYLYQDPRYFPYDHAVVLVGQGVTPEGLEYWIIQNSWGPRWGENGFMRVEKKDGIGIFGMNYMAQWMDVEPGYPLADF